MIYSRRKFALAGLAGAAVLLGSSPARPESKGVPRPGTITGAETGYEGALQALIAFYRAVNSRDLDALALNWAEGEEPSMSNPIGGIRRGWPEIRAVYERLFLGKARANFEFYDFIEAAGPGYHLFAGRERGFYETPEKKLALRIRTSRLFAERNGRWRQVHHHGSIEEPQLLADYQQMVLGAPLQRPAGQDFNRAPNE